MDMMIRTLFIDKLVAKNETHPKENGEGGEEKLPGRKVTSYVLFQDILVCQVLFKSGQPLKRNKQTDRQTELGRYFHIHNNKVWMPLFFKLSRP